MKETRREETRGRGFKRGEEKKRRKVVRRDEKKQGNVNLRKGEEIRREETG